ncbi:exported protein of unknown function [Georgfuchsia toluolica]|uniref:Tetratricopeptide repeat protein n=1 Tax=Georgfuchsia toluolica TaxID=424218 RepID=A0A916J4W9_9PROT|nr:tetratricopeptide repeat protein [Georgfuchsia toluolica]CAG4884012.1 exported protein of unknown function [Georgfuchsia toluolica]
MNFRIAIASVAFVEILLAPGARAADSADATFIAQGNQQWAAGRIDDAKKSFEQALAADPRSIDAHMKLAGLLLVNHNYAEAIQAYQRTIGLDANNAKAWMGLGLACLHSGQRELSRAAFGEAVRIDPRRKTQLAGLIEETAE